MAFKIEQHAKHEVIAGERLYLTADQTRVVKEGDKAAAFLLAGAGQTIPYKTALKFGLVAAPDEPKPKTTRVAAPDSTR